MATLEVNTSYILTNGYSLEAKELSAYGTSLNMSDPSTDDQHLWYLEDTGEDPFYRLHTRAKGNGQSLDVNPDDNTTVAFTIRGDYAGQFWRLDAAENGAFKLSNNWTGTNKHLDTYRDTLQPHMAVGDAIGQLWTFSRYLASTSGTSTATTISTGSASATASADRTLQGSGISTGAIVGATIGGVVGFVLVIGAILLWLRRSRKQRTAQQFNGSDLPSPEYSEKKPSQTYAHISPTSHQGYQHPAELSTNGPPAELNTQQKPIELNTSQEPVELPSKNVR